MKEPVDVELMGNRLTVACPEGEEHARQIAAFVDARMRALAEAKPGINVLHLALLAALNIADEYWKLRAEHGELERTISQWSQRVMAQITG